jgi:hypothetical protein
MNASTSISQTERLNLEATPTDPKEARWHGVLLGELDEVERAGEAPSLASVWKCPECGCQIQVVIAPVVRSINLSTVWTGRRWWPGRATDRRGF